MKLLTVWATTLLILPNMIMADDDILTTAASNGSFNTLVSLVVAAELDDALRDDGEFTVFAPTDEAFAKLPEDTLKSLRKPENREKLTKILKYHVVASEISIPKRRPPHPLKSATTLQGEKIRFERDGNGVKVNDSNVVIRDIRCSNGLIQVIDNVLLPPEPDDNSIIGIATQAGDFTTLLAAVEAAGLDEALSGKGPLTVLAPTDEAFAALPRGTLQNLLKPENKNQLATILKYHVVAGEITARAAVGAGNASTLANDKVNFSIREGRLTVNDANVISNDIEASNGIIHVIDQVLLPNDSLPSDISNDHARTSAQVSNPTSEITINAGWDENIRRDGIKAQRINIRCAAGGNIHLTKVTADEIVTRVAGGGAVSIAGTAKRHEATVNGGAVLRAAELISSVTKIQVYGGGDARINATDRIEASANSGATIRYVETDAEIKKSIDKYADFQPISANGH